ncbi:MAG TPA: endonuclease [Candidatus Amulumruptor caecigallinarius]|uniref:Endonuclease n=1 Tax=Candidatus Amulumruptor caecigallinarius TaxID=2109911 RepID=A0A921EAC5_9BACT|nr:endonuclease [Candidatus Amulumruptor caecigallinarius]
MKNRFSAIFSLSVLMLLLSDVCVWGAVPANYYQSIDGTSGATMKARLKELVKNHRLISSYSDLPSYFEKTDTITKQLSSGDYGLCWWDMYSDKPVLVSIRFGANMNREHCFPKSWWGGSESAPAYIDLFHMYPAEANANQAKLNWPLGEVEAATFDNGSVKVGRAIPEHRTSADKVFEPSDEYKGDFARTYMYMVTCYGDYSWNSNYMWMLSSENSQYLSLSKYAVDMLLEWNKLDPVSQKELDRNEVVYGIQGNRNPFIDHPEFADYIWGEKAGTPYEDTSVEINKQLFSPVKDQPVEFDDIALGDTETTVLKVRGQDLTGNINLRIYMGDKDDFRFRKYTSASAYTLVDYVSLAPSQVNADNGYNLVVEFTPTELGDRTARVLVSGDGIQGSFGISLKGYAGEMPTLTAPVALEATEITADTYQAQWEPVHGEEVDYYVITRTRYKGAQVVTEEITAEAPGVTIEDFAGSDYETYTVKSCRLKQYSPESNVVTVAHSGAIDGIMGDDYRDAYFVPEEGGVSVVCTRGEITVGIYDVSGRLIVTQGVHNGSFIPLSSGSYIATSDVAEPVKIMVK